MGLFKRIKLWVELRKARAALDRAQDDELEAAVVEEAVLAIHNRTPSDGGNPTLWLPPVHAEVYKTARDRRTAASRRVYEARKRVRELELDLLLLKGGADL